MVRLSKLKVIKRDKASGDPAGGCTAGGGLLSKARGTGETSSELSFSLLISQPRWSVTVGSCSPSSPTELRL